MSTAFTAIEFGTDLQTKQWRREMTIAELQDIEDKTIMDELYLALFERLAAAGCADPYYWEFMNFDTTDTREILHRFQGWCLGNLPGGAWGGGYAGWVDHINSSGSTIVNFTLDNFYLAAGLVDDDDNPVGFRRTNEWDGINEPTFEYGEIQRGDVIGYWIYEDLQKAFSALRWVSGAGGYSVLDLHAGSGVNPDIPTSIAECEYAFAQGDWGWHQYGTVLAQMLNALNYNGIFYCWLCRYQSRITGGATTAVSNTWDLWITTDHPTAYLGDPGTEVYECLDLPIPAPDVPTLVASGNQNSYIFDFGSVEQPPWCSTPPPNPEWGYIVSTRGYNYKSSFFVYKYDFTNQNTVP